jgi:hypothetical protein
MHKKITGNLERLRLIEESREDLRFSFSEDYSFCFMKEAGANYIHVGFTDGTLSEIEVNTNSPLTAGALCGRQHSVFGSWEEGKKLNYLLEKYREQAKLSLSILEAGINRLSEEIEPGNMQPENTRS